MPAVGRGLTLDVAEPDRPVDAAPPDAQFLRHIGWADVCCHHALHFAGLRHRRLGATRKVPVMRCLRGRCRLAAMLVPELFWPRAAWSVRREGVLAVPARVSAAGEHPS